MKRLIIIYTSLFFFAFTGLVVAAQSTLYNYNYLYRGPRTLGMGGAYTAVGRDAEGAFYNPATLYDMKFNIAVLNPLVEVDTNALGLYGDVLDAMDKDDDTDRISALTDIIKENMGKPLHGRAAIFPRVAWKSFMVGAIGQGEVDSRLHNPLSSAGAIEIKSLISYGPIIGGSMATPLTGLRIGVGAKLMNFTYMKENFTVNEFVAEDFDIADYVHDASDFSFDVGGLYDIQGGFLGGLNSQIGLSAMNITDLDYKEGGKIPMTLNLGFSTRPNTPIGEIVLAADIQDLTRNYEQDGSLWKRVHLGGEFGILNRHLTLRFGLNQGYGSFGAMIDFWIIKLSYAYYMEEMGAYAGQDKDPRHLMEISIGW